MSDHIASYSFLSWVRQGLASRIKNKPALGDQLLRRASVDVSVELKVGDAVLTQNGSTAFVSKTVQLIGPGDVLGISPRAIVRTDPRNWVTDFESNYLPFIEFYEEDFPWRFTPTITVTETGAVAVGTEQQKNTRLLPWIFLMVLEESEFKDIPAVSGLLPAIELLVNWTTILPPPAQAWAWAHVHVSRDITSGTITTPNQLIATKDLYRSLLQQNPDHTLSRLLSPRKLKPNKAYHAFVIPSFELGRLAGLGREPAGGIGILDASWGTEVQTDFPVYYRWYFRTGERGDFEYLVRLLEPRDADSKVGIRDMDMQDRSFGVRGIRAGSATDRVIGLEGALRSPLTHSNPKNWPPEFPPEMPDVQESYKTFLSDLEKIVNLQQDLQIEETNASGHTLLNQQDPSVNHPDPIISPPLYGRWHALQHTLKVGEPGWVNELNQDPRLRVPAGFGTKVIQAGQEDYMQRAWQQLGDALRVNQKIRQVQVSLAASFQLYLKNLSSLASTAQDAADPNQQLKIIAMTRQMHSRVLRNGATLSQELRTSKIETAVKPAFRRVLRPSGPIMRKAFRQRPPRTSEVLVKLNAGAITAAAEKKPPAHPLFLRDLGTDFLSEGKLTSNLPRATDRIDFDITLPEVAFPTDSGTKLPDAAKSLAATPANAATNFFNAVEALHKRLNALPPKRAVPTAADTSTITGALVTALNPKNTILQRASSLIYIPETIPSPPTETIVPVMIRPVFADPMYKQLRDLSTELLLPNLNLIPNNTICLLETNPKFIEAYMVGLNHEMSRELLWREYPTDLCGSYFRQFWDVSDIINRAGVDPKEFEESLRDIKPIDEWNVNEPLGNHDPENRSLPTGHKLVTPAAPKGDRDLVLVIRGDLLKRYPTAIIFAQEAMWYDEEDPVVRKLKPHGQIKEHAFKAQIEPDLYFLGFDLKETKAKGSPDRLADDPGWFFVIQERPGEPRFGMDLNPENKELTDLDKLFVWNYLTWEHLRRDGNGVSVINVDIRPETGPHPAIADRDATSQEEKDLEEEHKRDLPIKWGTNAADTAYILFQAPVMVAIHASNMLPD
jgi:hypothetical protein